MSLQILCPFFKVSWSITGPTSDHTQILESTQLWSTWTTVFPAVTVERAATYPGITPSIAAALSHACLLKEDTRAYPSGRSCQTRPSLHHLR